MCLYLSLILAVYPLAQFIVGIYYQRECHHKVNDQYPNFSAWLLTNSVALVLCGFSMIYFRVKLIPKLVGLFLFIWLIRGSYLVFTNFTFLEQVSNRDSPCNHICFIASVCSVIMSWCLFLFFVLFFTTYIFYSKLFKPQLIQRAELSTPGAQLNTSFT